MQKVKVGFQSPQFQAIVELNQPPILCCLEFPFLWNIVDGGIFWNIYDFCSLTMRILLPFVIGQVWRHTR